MRILPGLLLTALLAGAVPSGPVLQSTRPAAAAELSAGDAQAYRLAFARVKADQWTEAFSLVRGTRDPLPAKVIRWTYLTAANSGATYQEIADFLVANPQWPRQDTLRLRAETAIGPATPRDVVAQWFRRFPPVSGGGMVKLGAVLIAQGKQDEGVTWLRKAWRGEDLSLADEQSVLAALGRYLTAEDHAARMDYLLWSGDRAGAQRLLNLVPAADAQIAAARIAYQQGAANAGSARPALSPSARTAGLLYDRIRWLRKNDLDQMAQDELLAVPVEAFAVQPQKWWEVRRVAVRRLLRLGQAQAAYALANNHHMTEGTGFADAEFLAGWIALRFLNMPQEAYRHFTTLHQGVRSPISVGRGAYWSGRAAAALGDQARAERWYREAARFPTVFYGQLAADALGGGEALHLPPEPQPTREDLAKLQNDELARAVRLLAELDLAERAKPFLQQMLVNSITAGERRLIGELAERIGRREMSIAAAKESEREGTPLIQRGYPVIAMPGAAPVERALALSITRQESAFDVGAVSPVGARGLMQLMPDTAKMVAGKLGLRYEAGRLTTDPVYNMTLGTAYLADRLDRFDGSYVMTIAAYNAGAGRVNQWVQSFGDPRHPGVDVVDWIEQIPFEETRSYVQRVLENTQIYRYRLDPSGNIRLQLVEDLIRTRGGPVRHPVLAAPRVANQG
ncbi:lytic transglycosylase domain-containing protein [Zavarzinia sp. CC-PAN008]|uniref:lytic transglycosylase domain-containing protein n=1 Tax=Zavarzinia sp. CC-PAN008 TaxID=3243332 RepID=UPI003F748B66